MKHLGIVFHEKKVCYLCKEAITGHIIDTCAFSYVEYFFTASSLHALGWCNTIVMEPRCNVSSNSYYKITAKKLGIIGIRARSQIGNRWIPHTKYQYEESMHWRHFRLI